VTDTTPATLDVQHLPTTELLVLYGRLLDELNDRKAVRSRNAPPATSLKRSPPWPTTPSWHRSPRRHGTSVTEAVAESR
jgi:hypothetical protein